MRERNMGEFIQRMEAHELRGIASFGHGEYFRFYCCCGTIGGPTNLRETSRLMHEDHKKETVNVKSGNGNT